MYMYNAIYIAQVGLYVIYVCEGTYMYRQGTVHMYMYMYMYTCGNRLHSSTCGYITIDGNCGMCVERYLHG